MNELYTIPKDCYSRMEAIKMFDKFGFHGDIDLGFITIDEKEIVVWQCKSSNNTTYLSIIKDTNQEPVAQKAYFVPIEAGCPFVYCSKLFYYSDNMQILQVDVLFDAYWAQAALTLATDVFVETSDLRLCKAINLLNQEEQICWMALIQEDVLVPYTFVAFLNTPDNFPKDGEPYTYQRLDEGDTFEHQGYLWQIENGNNGIKMTRLCPTAYHGKTS